MTNIVSHDGDFVTVQFDAKRLCGEHIGEAIIYRRGDGRVWEIEEINMITHKKNGNVIVRWYPTRQIELRPTDQVLQKVKLVAMNS